MPTFSSRAMAFSVEAALDRRRTTFWARVTFSRVVLCGKRLNDWKTMPTSARTLLISGFSIQDIDAVDQNMAPCPRFPAGSDSAAGVLLPEPEGPITTTTSPASILADTSTRALTEWGTRKCFGYVANLDHDVKALLSRYCRSMDRVKVRAPGRAARRQTTAQKAADSW